jgi:hypothetical protein
LFGKINWVCTICGQDFTRRSSGKRHNSNLHGGIAKLVRPFDYITGRLNHQISSPARDPSAYRRHRGHDKSHYKPDNNALHIGRTFVKQNDVRWDNSRHTVVHERNLPKQELGQQYQDKNNYIRGILEAPKPSSRISKFEELKMLASKHYRPDDAKKLLTVVTAQVLIDKNENFLDTTLEQLRDRDRFASGNYNSG